MKKIMVSFLLLSFVGASFAGVNTDGKKRKKASQKIEASQHSNVEENHKAAKPSAEIVKEGIAKQKENKK